MSTYKILSNVLDFLEQKAKLSCKQGLPQNEEVEVSADSISWRKTYPEDKPEEDQEKSNRMSRDICDVVKFHYWCYYNSDNKSWTRTICLSIQKKNQETYAEIPVYLWNRFHPTILRSTITFHKIERMLMSQDMLKIDKALANVDPDRIDDILQGVVDGKKETHESKT